MLGGLTRAGWEVTGEPAAADLLPGQYLRLIEPACKEAVDTILDLARLRKPPGKFAWWWPAAWCSAMARSLYKTSRKSICSSG